MSSRLVLKNVGVRRNGRWLVRGVTTAAETGEVLGIIGPNGAGKTTVLETIAGLRLPTEGAVCIDGTEPRSFRAAAATFSFLPDTATLPEETTVRTNVDHAVRHARRLAEPLLRALDIADLLDMPAGVLSRGERQRVSLFCTLVLGRNIAVLDEPLAPFDPLQVRSVVSALQTVAEAGTTIVATFHQLRDAERLANRFLLLADGRQVACGDLPSLRGLARASSDATLEDVFVALLSKPKEAPPSNGSKDDEA
jgi:ABC-2 type transport system ATP-binding protein